MLDGGTGHAVRCLRRRGRPPDRPVRVQSVSGSWPTQIETNPRRCYGRGFFFGAGWAFTSGLHFALMGEPRRKRGVRPEDAGPPPGGS